MSTAQQLKDKGNKAFGNKEYQLAAKYYGDAITLDPSNPVLYSNRANAYTKIKDYQRALSDCNTGLQVSQIDTKTRVKLLWRKSLSLTELNDYGTAKQCLLEALALDRNNQTVITELQRLENILSNQDLVEIPIEVFDSLPDEYKRPQNHQKNLVSSSPSPSLIQDDAPKLVTQDHPEHPTALFLSTLNKYPTSERTQFYSYVIQMDPEEYHSLFHATGIDSEFLSFYVEAAFNYLEKNDTKYTENIIKHLQLFTSLPRFSIASMFVSDKDVDRIFTIIEQKTSQNLRSLWS